jgi:DNA-binding Lrp family transcriptional regulator
MVPTALACTVRATAKCHMYGESAQSAGDGADWYANCSGKCHANPRPKEPTVSPLDTKILGLLIKDGRATFADIARDLNVSRAHVRERVNKLIDEGVIEQFTAVVNPEKLGKAVSAFFDVKVSPAGIQQVAQELAAQPEVVSLYIMNDMQSLHMHTLTEDMAQLEQFSANHLFGKEAVRSVDCKTLMSRLKNRRGGPRL